MTMEAMLDLGRRAVACPGWRWLPGMLIARGANVGPWRLHASPGGLSYVCECCTPADGWGFVLGRWEGDATPDFDDPATLGCLLALVRDAWGDPETFVASADGRFVGGIRSSDGELFTGATEVEALVVALEGAHGRGAGAHPRGSAGVAPGSAARKAGGAVSETRWRLGQDSEGNTAPVPCSEPDWRAGWSSEVEAWEVLRDGAYAKARGVALAWADAWRMQAALREEMTVVRDRKREVVLALRDARQRAKQEGPKP